MRHAAVWSLAIALSACGPAPAGRGALDGGGNAGVDGGGGSTADAAVGDDGCSAAARLIYTIDKDLRLSAFDPSTRTFTDRGTLACPAAIEAKPLSMAVNRAAIAYVLYNSGELFAVDTATLACTATTWDQDLRLYSFGMGFSTDQAGGTAETLFIAGKDVLTGPPTMLARLDTSTFLATKLANLSGQPELTGTGTGELWGYFPSSVPPQLIRLDKATGAALQTYAITNPTGAPTSFAFAFWGGDFWVFLYRSTDTATSVYQLDGASGALVSTTSTTGRRVVGAGVSTCAPPVIL